MEPQVKYKVTDKEVQKVNFIGFYNEKLKKKMLFF